MSDVVSYTGDSMSFDVTISNNAGDEVNVSTATAITYGIYDRDGVVQVSKTLGAGITVDGYVVTVTIDAVDTAGLPSELYVHEMQIITLGGTVHTVLQGDVWLRQDYIKAML
jgi:hypothetical protein